MSTPEEAPSSVKGAGNSQHATAISTQHGPMPRAFSQRWAASKTKASSWAHFAHAKWGNAVKHGESSGKRSSVGSNHGHLPWADTQEEIPSDIDPNSRRGRIMAFCKSQTFDLIVGVLIIGNALTMCVALEYDGVDTARLLGVSPDTTDWPHAEEAFHVIEHFFTIVFLIELTIRLWVFGFRYFKSPANTGDACIVIISILDMYILSQLGVTIPNVTFLRLLRIAKLSRVLRIVRVLRIFRQLRVLVHSIQSSVGALGWSMVLLGLIQVISTILMTQSLQSYLQDPDAPQDTLETRLFVYEHFGTFARGFLTMFEITLAPGAWGKIGRTIIYEVSRAYLIFFFVYVSGVTFAIIRVITAIFLKETLAAAATDQELVISERMHQQDKYIQNLRTLFEEMDTDGTASISLEELNMLLVDPRAKTWLGVLELEINEVTGLFNLLDDGDGQVSFDEFISGVMRLKGSAKNIDLITLLYENKKVTEKIRAMEDGMMILGKDIGKMMLALGVSH
eukprot:gnl/MRDRNA2_/MRDRNA2_72537_c0_seq1.p1 gnl/MRDRNA2_/MRDRNA2_72537_c0~~gnl/MRDRNA2_/MRDRNA2_72537_c0_seq1.p1  ORF type:complete len:529 (-),score=71.05 gnl/MRDRNA2_/MRDRNA2_72537_c0_seq1:65-1588(-)